MKIHRPFYIVSPRSDLKTLNPAVPNNFLIRGGWIDSKLPRISIFKSVSDAISATYLGEKLRPEMKLYVYEVQGINPESLIGPLSISEIPYFQALKEWWYLRSVSLKFIAEIKIERLLETLEYHYGPRQTRGFVYKWRWSEVIPKYQEKFGPKLKRFSDGLDNLNDRQLERLANKVVSHRKKRKIGEK